jgi:hypothetical protein
MFKNKTFNNAVFSFIVLTFLFGRSFVGIYIFGFRLGELLALLSFLGTTLLVVKNTELIDFYGKKIIYSCYLILFSFLISFTLSNSIITNTYTFKSSSYLWAISWLFLGYFYFKNFNFKRVHLLILNFSLIYLYVLSTVNYPDLFITFLNNYSDKWDFNKASSLMLCFIIVILLNNKLSLLKNFSLDFFLLASALYLPLILYKSRGSFIALLLFVFIQTFENRKILFKSAKRYVPTICISIIVLITSSLNVVNVDIEELLSTEFSIFGSSSVVEKLAGQKDTNVDAFFSFYSRDSRIFSTDGNVNWRIQIWQDVIFDLKDQEKTLYGYGYKDIIPAMTIDERKGRDGLNEHVHNFLVNIFARGGILQLIIFILFYYFLTSKTKNITVFSYILPLLVVSFFDASMENAHFPILFYFFLPVFMKE